MTSSEKLAPLYPSLSASDLGELSRGGDFGRSSCSFLGLDFSLSLAKEPLELSIVPSRCLYEINE